MRSQTPQHRGRARDASSIFLTKSTTIQMAGADRAEWAGWGTASVCLTGALSTAELCPHGCCCFIRNGLHPQNGYTLVL